MMKMIRRRRMGKRMARKKAKKMELRTQMMIKRDQSKIEIGQV